MRLFEITEPQSMSDDDLVEFIHKNCQAWLAETRGHLFYRGVKSSFAKAGSHNFIAQVRDDRVPTDSTEDATHVFNTAIHMAGGVANRTNSMFITSNYSDALSYAFGRNTNNLFVALPIGDFSYTWSPAFEDWYQSAIHNGKILQYVFPNVIIDRMYRYFDMEEITEVEWKDTPGFIETDEGVAAYELPVFYTTIDGEEMIEELPVLIDADDVDVHYLSRSIMVDKNLDKAGDLKHEVMIRPTGGKVLMVQADFYREYVRPAL